jgi:hypothetical protein
MDGFISHKAAANKSFERGPFQPLVNGVTAELILARGNFTGFDKPGTDQKANRILIYRPLELPEEGPWKTQPDLVERR